MLNGFFLIDKQSGLNSFKLVVALRKRAGQKRVGFAGTLDPLASGLMVLALGEYTKLLPYLEASDKVYQVNIALDGFSDTMDMEGVVTKLDLKALIKPDLEMVSKIIEQRFTGMIMQVPPRHSAIQIDGKRAYDMARAGQDFEMKARPVRIFSIEILRYEFPELELKVHCSSGTYIRSLANDLGKAMGVGGYVTALRRLKIADLEVGVAVNLEELSAENLGEKIDTGRGLFVNMLQLNLVEAEYAVLAKGNFVPWRDEWKDQFEMMRKIEKFNQNDFLAIYKDQIVGVVELCEEGRSLKFKKKLNIF